MAIGAQDASKHTRRIVAEFDPAMSHLRGLSICLAKRCLIPLRRQALHLKTRGECSRQREFFRPSPCKQHDRKE